MKSYKVITVITIILAIALIIAMSFFGVYKQKEYKMVNIIPEYLLGMEFAGGITVDFEVDNSVNTVIYDKDGNVVEDDSEDGNHEGHEHEEYTEENGYVTVEEKVNNDEVLTEQNFEKAKSILQKRLTDIGVKQYNIRQDKASGRISIDIPEDENTNSVINLLIQNGKFEMQDSETKEILMNNSDISKATVVYGQEQINSETSVYLQIQFNKEGTKKLEEISKIYIGTIVKENAEDSTEENEEDTEETKNVSIIYDDNTLLTTYFGDTMANGIINIYIGAGTTQEEINAYMQEGRRIAIALNIGEMPIVYTPNAEDVSSTIEIETIRNSIYVVVGIMAIAMLVLVIIFKTKGVYSVILQIGYIASLLMILRLTNVVITLEGIFAIVIAIAINYITMYMILNSIIKDKMNANQAILDTTKKTAILLMPVYIIAVVFSFATSSNVASFGMVIVWGTILFCVYNILFTRTLLNK